MKSNSWELILAVVACLVCSTTSHVALTFPPARTYDLDFLDTSRTPGPCGMPKGKIFFCLKYFFDISGERNLNIIFSCLNKNYIEIDDPCEIW